MKKFILIFLFLSSCVNNNLIVTDNNIKVISSNIKLDLGPGSKGIDYNLGPSSKGITNLKFNIKFVQDITKDFKIEISKEEEKKFNIEFLSINKDNVFYINSPDLEIGKYKIKAITNNETKNISIQNYIEINSNKEIKIEVYNYNEKPELLDISIKVK